MNDEVNLSKRFDNVLGRSQKLKEIILEIQSIKKQVSEIYEKKLYGITGPKETPKVEVLELYDKFYSLAIGGLEIPTTRSWPIVSGAINAIVEEETVVGFDEEAMTIIERLTGVQQKLDVISIVGMAGLGKTTLARKVYNHPFIANHFYIRGWIYVGQEYCKRDLLLGILSYVVKYKVEIYMLSEEKLGEEMYKRLNGRRYLIVMDDLRDLGAWNDLRKYFPNDNNGSRILLTTRLTNVALYIKPDKPPHSLRFLTKDESWDLLQQKSFSGDRLPPDLKKIGKKIAARCQGLPLAIVVVAGLLVKKEKTKEVWNQVAETMPKCIVDGDDIQFLGILEMSLGNLPTHLKSCFLYLGGFQTNSEIPVWKLICLWIAEQFVLQTGQESLEDVAEGYLMDLIDRNLVIPAKKTSDGKIKMCRIHYMLYYLCQTRGKLFPEQIYKRAAIISSDPILYKYPNFLSQKNSTFTGKSFVPHFGFLSEKICRNAQLSVGNTFFYKL